MSSYVVKVENVSKSFGGRIVLKDITFSLREGEVLGVLGKSGAG
ncbi:MAG: peptide ABC transporter ATP-binding protein, partial [Candidatus Bathyarchaeota archaeon]|nr:peptide ABC transporter ATP-binding protein [Candidatus Bathyarchaeota archaeon]